MALEWHKVTPLGSGQTQEVDNKPFTKLFNGIEWENMGLKLSVYIFILTGE